VKYERRLKDKQRWQKDRWNLVEFEKPRESEKIEIGHGGAQKVPEKNLKKPFELLTVKRFSKETQQIVFIEKHVNIQKFSLDSIGHLCLEPVGTVFFTVPL
jgi:hypothetical protein